MNEQEKQDLARWLAERLGEGKRNQFWVAKTVPVYAGDVAHLQTTYSPAPLDGNFAAAVIATLWETRRWWVAFSGEPGNYRACFFHGKEAIEEVRHDAEDTFYLAVCLAARAALEGGA